MPDLRINDHRAIQNATLVASRQSKYIELRGDEKAISLLQHKIRSVQIDCCFRFADTRWGHIDNTCSGVIYIDLTIEQPEDCRLTSALTTITLTPVNSKNSEAEAEDRRGSKTAKEASNATAATTSNSTITKPVPSSSGLEITEFFGPKAIYGKGREASYSTKYLIQPEINASVATVGGMGLEHNKQSTDTTRWKFVGLRRGIVCEDSTSRSANDARTETKKFTLPAAKYQQIRWRLEENQGESHVFRSPTLHTAFAFEHGNKPFFLEVEFEGKLRHRHHRALERLVFPPKMKKANARAKIDAEKRSRGINEDLKSLAMSLDESMVERNNRSQGKVIRELEQFEGIPTTTPGLQNVTQSLSQLPRHTLAQSPLTKTEETTTTKKTTTTGTGPNQSSMNDILAISHQLLNLEQVKVEETKAEIPISNGSITMTKATPKLETTSTDSLTINNTGSALILSIARYISLYWATIATWLAYIQKRLNSQNT